MRKGVDSIKKTQENLVVIQLEVAVPIFDV
ncbi:MAG: hypothetical protein ACJAQ2_000811 [Vicingaceae bacterium]|jgi:hypothetical protein